MLMWLTSKCSPSMSSCLCRKQSKIAGKLVPKAAEKDVGMSKRKPRTERNMATKVAGKPVTKSKVTVVSAKRQK
eukprot:scaffold160749_cov31-Prasinocladus_malaysianus.AAC.1